MAQIVELVPDRDLIDPDFPGYKLSLDPVPIYSTDLDVSAFVAQQGDQQFSYAHARVFSLHNHLLVSSYFPNFVFFVDADWNIVQVSIGLANRVDVLTKVCAIPKTRNSEPGDFPVTVQFASAQRAVIFDGTGSYHVALVKKDKWVIIFTDSLPYRSVVLSAKQFENRLCILARSITEPKFVSFLDYFVLDDNWQSERTKKVQLTGNLLFATISTSSSLLVLTEGRQKLPIFVNSETELIEEPKPKYEWTQTADDIGITVNLKGNTGVVRLDGQKITILVKDDEIINGEFAHPVEDVTWTTTADKLELTGLKVEVGLGWQEVIKGDTNGKQFQAVAEEIEEATFNSEELDEVDATGPAALLRLQTDTDTITHKVDLSTQPWIFSLNLQPGNTGLCFRNLTDACVWTFTDTGEAEWTAKHIGTFPAFGYVQASKTMRKFITAPHDFRYVIIAESSRRLYLFRQPCAVNGNLRNRTAGVRVAAVAKQQLINLQDNDEILGISATKSCLHLLTKKKFYVLVIN